MARPTILRLMPVLDFGGVESRIALQSELSVDRPYDFQVATFDKDGASADRVRASGTKLHVLGVVANPKSPKALWSLLKLLRRVKPDLVHASIVEANVLAIAACAITRTPLIVEEVGQPKHSLKGRLAFRALYQLPERIVAVSKVTRDYLIDADGAPQARTVLCYNCANPSFFTEKRAEPKRPDRGVTTFVAIGRLHPIKNHAPLVKAMAKLKSRGVPARLRLVGDGPLRNELEALAKSLDVLDRVEFEGFRSDVREVMLDVDAFVLPSKSEGCSISLIESMATALPSLGSDVPGIREVMGDEHASRWTFTVDAVEQIADRLEAFVKLDKSERHTIARTLQERAYSEFSPASYMRRVETMYQEVLGARWSLGKWGDRAVM